MRSGLSQQVAADYCRALYIVFGSMVSGKPIANASAVAAEAIQQANVQLPESLVNNLAKVVEARSAWLESFLSYDPSKDICATRCPVMAINGSNDLQVAADINLGAIRRLLPAHTFNVIKTYDGLNHLFQHCTTGMPNEYGQIEETMSEEVMKDIAEWIVKMQ